ncbi:GyrI-like domain-containing protein [Prauserella muralis]|uniref:AraC effector-binding domain-containing protein n=1 Tax=Prauserella muralis TaxID=588067 RepID=A0A2V4AQ78_9PSEU|nr:GyrI-like domain-containing protein [Prauserella muralis]PXY22174.1 hypothetical protein BAY60_19975 [Prauserella muralis]
MNYDVTICDMPDRTAFVQRQRVDADRLGDAIGSTIGSLVATAGRYGLTPAGAPEVAYLSEYSPEQPVELEVRVPVAGAERLGPGHGAPLAELSAGRCVRTVHQGPYDKIGDAYAALDKWIAVHGHHAAGPPTEVYLVGPDRTGTPEEYRTEVSIPIEQ